MTGERPSDTAPRQPWQGLQAIQARQGRQDLALCAAGLLAILAWELSGADLAVAQWYGDAGGFPLRDAWFTRDVMHTGGRWLAAALFSLLALGALLLRGPPPMRQQRIFWLFLVIAGLLLVPTMKRFSATSCPYDLVLFGGLAPYVPHWLPGAGDGGPARCFPSGHAVAAFAFLPLYFRWRGARPVAARLAATGVWVAGIGFGWAQVARGAHFPSHVLWSAWICWATGCAGAWAWQVYRSGRASPTTR